MNFTAIALFMLFFLFINGVVMIGVIMGIWEMCMY